MKPALIASRKYYFSLLFSSLILLAVLIILIGKQVSPFRFNNIFLFLSFINAFIPAGLFIYRWKSKRVSLKTFKLLCIIAYIPVLVGFLTSILFENYLYLVLFFPVFFLSYIVIVPTENFIEES